jgi:transcriptional regulator with GAF, ATPase, and Fis domain
MSAVPVKENPRLEAQAKAQEGSGAAPRVLSEVEIRSLERNNLQAALQAANGKIRGPAGAAELLGIKPTTLLARMKKWGVRKQ